MPPHDRHEYATGAERRVITPELLTVRRIPKRAAAGSGSGDGEGTETVPQIHGHAAVFGSWTTLYQGKSYVWKERVNPGAFANAIKEGQDVRCLFNHDPNFVLGRTASGTCRIAEDKVGLYFESDPPPTDLIEDLVLTPMSRSDISQCSFSFKVRSGGEKITIREENDIVTEERELTDVDLFDVSPVTYPAYEDTDCSLAERGALREREIRQARETKRGPSPIAIARRDGMARSLALLDLYRRIL
jgi:uncharacterized protein